MFSPYSGIVVIKGKEYNYAEYDGNLFFLSPIELIDRTNNKIKYSIIRDEWAFAVKNKIRIQGTVIKTLDTELLKDNIQLTQPVIPQPAKLHIVNLFEDEGEVIHIHEPPHLDTFKSEVTISKKGVEALIDSENEKSEDVSILFPSLGRSWKEALIPYIKKLIEEISSGNYIFGKVSQIESSIKYMWCLTPNEASKRITDHPEDSVYVSEIDFRGLTEINPVSISHHEFPAKANTQIPLDRELIVEEKKVKKDKAKITEKDGKKKHTFKNVVGDEPLRHGSIFKLFQDNFYFLKKGDKKLYFERLALPVGKQKWIEWVKTKKVDIDKTLNKIDAKLSENREFTLNAFYEKTRSWVKSISPNFTISEDLNVPLPKLSDGSYDYEKIFDYFIYPKNWKTGFGGVQKGHWIVFYLKPRPKFWYEWYSVFTDPHGKSPLYLWLWELKVSAWDALIDVDLRSKQLINEWYRSTDSTFEDPVEGQTVGSIYTTTEEKLKTEMSLFDLVGTEYLLLIYKGAPHLIFKNVQLTVKGKKLNIQSLEQLPALSLYEQINQSSFLQVFHKSIPLKDKINPDYVFNTVIKVITHEDSISYDYAFVKHEGALDGICEVVEYPKRKVATIGGVSGSEIENNYIAQQRSYEDLQLKRKEIAFRRSSEDLEWNRKWDEHNRKYVSSVVDIALGLATAGIGFAKAKATSFALSTVAGGKLAKGGFETLGGLQQAAVDMAALERKQLEGRALENYSLELNHHRHDYDMKRNLRNMGNVQQAASVTYRDVINQSNKELGANEIHLRMWTPTDLQLETIKKLYENNGVDCFIGGVTIQVDETLSGIWQFSHIDAIATDDGMVLNYLLGLFINGVRIVPNDVIFNEPIKTVQTLLVPSYLQEELQYLRNEIKAQEQATQLYKGLVSYASVDAVNKIQAATQDIRDENERLKEEKEEWDKEKGKYEEEIKELKDDVRKLEKDDEHKKQQLKLLVDDYNIVAVAKRDLEDKYKALEVELNQCKNSPHQQLVDEKTKKAEELEKCLANYKKEYKDLFTKFVENGKKIRYFYEKYFAIMAQFAISVNPGIYNNSWYAADWRNWAYKKLGDQVMYLWDGIIYSYSQLREQILADPIIEKGTAKDEDVANLYQLLHNTSDAQRALIPFLKAENVGWINRLNNVVGHPSFWGNEVNAARLWSNEFSDARTYKFPEELETCQIPEAEEVKECGTPEERAKAIANLEKLNKLVSDLKQKLDAAKALKKQDQDPKESQAYKDLQASLTVCNNNLETLRNDYKELEKEAETQKNLAALYKQESEKFKTERDEKEAERVQALKDRDAARAEELKAKNYFKDDPITAQNANANERTARAIGVGKQFSNMLLNGYFLKINIDQAIVDYKNRQRSNQQTIANIGWYLNYLMDGIVRVMRPYIGNRESAFAYSNKIPEVRLRDIRQKRAADAKTAIQPPDPVLDS